MPSTLNYLVFTGDTASLVTKGLMDVHPSGADTSKLLAHEGDAIALMSEGLLDIHTPKPQDITDDSHTLPSPVKAQDQYAGSVRGSYTKPNPIYSDVNQFTPTDVPLVVDVEDIFQSIYNILTTNLGERLFNPEFGCRISDVLFELINEETAFLIRNNVLDAISRWEPRVELDMANTFIYPDYDNHTYWVRLAFRLIGLGEQRYEYSGALSRLAGGMNG